MISNGDAARAEEFFFVITSRHPGTDQVKTVLTLRSQDVIVAEIVKDGAVIERVAGRGPSLST